MARTIRNADRSTVRNLRKQDRDFRKTRREVRSLDVAGLMATMERDSVKVA